MIFLNLLPCGNFWQWYWTTCLACFYCRWLSLWQRFFLAHLGAIVRVGQQARISHSVSSLKSSRSHSFPTARSTQLQQPRISQLDKTVCNSLSLTPTAREPLLLPTCTKTSYAEHDLDQLAPRLLIDCRRLQGLAPTVNHTHVFYE